jgi:hypothetical protein
MSTNKGLADSIHAGYIKKSNPYPIRIKPKSPVKNPIIMITLYRFLFAP